MTQSDIHKAQRCFSNIALLTASVREQHPHTTREHLCKMTVSDVGLTLNGQLAAALCLIQLGYKVHHKL